MPPRKRRVIRTRQQIIDAAAQTLIANVIKARNEEELRNFARHKLGLDDLPPVGTNRRRALDALREQLKNAPAGTSSAQSFAQAAANAASSLAGFGDAIADAARRAGITVAELNDALNKMAPSLAALQTANIDAGEEVEAQVTGVYESAEIVKVSALTAAGLQIDFDMSKEGYESLQQNGGINPGDIIGVTSTSLSTQGPGTLHPDQYDTEASGPSMDDPVDPNNPDGPTWGSLFGGSGEM